MKLWSYQSQLDAAAGTRLMGKKAKRPRGAFCLTTLFAGFDTGWDAA